MYQRRLIQVWSVISEQLASVCSVKRIIYIWIKDYQKKQGELEDRHFTIYPVVL